MSEITKVETLKLKILMNGEKPIVAFFDEFEKEITTILKGAGVEKPKTIEVPFLLVGYGRMMSQVAEYVQARREGRDPDEEIDMSRGGGRPGGRRF